MKMDSLKSEYEPWLNCFIIQIYNKGFVMKNILIINGHPDKMSFCQAIALAYLNGAKENNQVELLNLHQLNFELNLKHGYREKLPLEDDLMKAQEMIQKADHIVIVTPIWWGGPTALLKGFLDRTFLPGFAFKYRPNSIMWDKLLANKTAHLIVTSDGPAWYMRFLRGDTTVKLLKESTLEFCGISPVRVTRLGNIKSLSHDDRLKILKNVSENGKKGINLCKVFI